MYTSAKINPEKKAIHSSKRIFLDHKEQQYTMRGTKTLSESHDTVNAKVYYTNIPFDGKSTNDIVQAHNITTAIVEKVIKEQAMGEIDITTKVREKDQAIVSDITFNKSTTSEDNIKGAEKDIWHPLKMETLKALIAHPEIGHYVPLNDHQVEQLTKYLEESAMQ